MLAKRFVYLFERASEGGERQREQDCPCAGSLLRWPQ